MKNSLFYFIYWISLTFCPQLVNSQNLISISSRVGLVKGNNYYGNAFNPDLGFEFDKILVNASYVYAELNNTSYNSNLKLNKYSITAGYVILFHEDKFRFNGSLGPSLLNYENGNNIGLDIGLTLSCNLVKSLNLEMSVVNTFNNTTSNLVQAYFGFKYNLYKQKD